MTAETNIGQLDRLMGGFPWTLERGLIPMGPQFPQWTLTGQGFGDRQFVVRGHSPDEVVMFAIHHLAGWDNPPPPVDLQAQFDKTADALAKLQARADAVAEKANDPTEPPATWRNRKWLCEDLAGIYSSRAKDGVTTFKFKDKNYSGQWSEPHDTAEAAAQALQAFRDQIQEVNFDAVP